jgi:hypothetical protein
MIVLPVDCCCRYIGLLMRYRSPFLVPDALWGCLLLSTSMLLLSPLVLRFTAVLPSVPAPGITLFEFILLSGPVELPVVVLVVVLLLLVSLFSSCPPALADEGTSRAICITAIICYSAFFRHLREYCYYYYCHRSWIRNIRCRRRQQ